MADDELIVRECGKKVVDEFLEHIEEIFTVKLDVLTLRSSAVQEASSSNVEPEATSYKTRIRLLTTDSESTDSAQNVQKAKVCEIPLITRENI